ncbi:MAG: hypothetical protein K0S46_1841 [Moraxellaceae bacterium]|jgi:vacuolar-type H+-ATPase subunit H|nr:hypothetical protein [Moraxellaceae bacterium]
MIDRHEYVQKLKEKLDAWDSEIDTLEERLKDLKGEAEQRARLALEDLKLTRTQLTQRVDELLSTSDDALQRIRLSFESAWDNVKTGISAVRSELAPEKKETEK